MANEFVQLLKQAFPEYGRGSTLDVILGCLDQVEIAGRIIEDLNLEEGSREWDVAFRASATPFYNMPPHLFACHVRQQIERVRNGAKEKELHEPTLAEIVWLFAEFGTALKLAPHASLVYVLSAKEMANKYWDEKYGHPELRQKILEVAEETEEILLPQTTLDEAMRAKEQLMRSMSRHTKRPI